MMNAGQRACRGVCGAAMVVVLAMLASVAAPAAAQVSNVNSLPGGTPIVLPAANLDTQGPVAYGTMTFTSNVPTGSLYGWTGGYVFGNGTVLPGSAPILALDAGHTGVNDAYATMSLSFANPIQGFLAYLNWTDRGVGNDSINSTILAAYNPANALIGLWVLNNNGNNIGRAPGYYGFSSTTANIARIDFDNGFMGARDLSYIGAPLVMGSAVPEPAGWAMMILGFGAVGGALRKRRRRFASA